MALSEGGAGGAIVNLSSRAVQGGGSPGLLPYAASKAAVETMTVGLARQVAAEGIRVNAVSPGVIATEMHAESGDAAALAARASDIPLGRLGTPEEVAETILWLLSPAASYVTGAVLAVAGAR
jgi:NAD(P)-dependent dehydrogenase (short-subunit alcohol dehydrogenase family)